MVDRLGIQRWRYEYGIRKIEAAYRASRASFDNEVQYLNDAWKKHEIVYGEDEDYDGYRDHLISQHEEAANALSLIRESFALTLYHFWEKQAMDWLGKKSYDAKGAFSALIDRGYLVAEDEIDRMRMTANTIKHGDKKLYGKHPEMFDDGIKPFISEGVEASYHYYLRVTDANMEEFIAALLASGPNADPRVGL